MSYYVEQDDLGTVKAWFEENRRLRREEAARLEQRLEEVNAELDEFEDRLEEHREREAKLMFHRMDLTPTPMEEGIERYSRSLRQRKWDFTRQLRDLVRGTATTLNG
jgi:predicted nuclease with TOPRIM domain